MPRDQQSTAISCDQPRSNSGAWNSLVASGTVGWDPGDVESTAHAKPVMTGRPQAYLVMVGLSIT